MGANQITPRGSATPLRTEWQEVTERRLQSLEEVSNEILRRLHPRDHAAAEQAGGLRHVAAADPRYDAKTDPPATTPALHRAMARLDALCDGLHKQLTDLSDQLTPVLGAPVPPGADSPGTSQGPPGNASIVQALWTVGDRLEQFITHTGAVQRRLEL